MATERTIVDLASARPLRAGLLNLRDELDDAAYRAHFLRVSREEFLREAGRAWDRQHGFEQPRRTE